MLEAERALKAGDFAACGAAMNASHASMRDDFAITCPEIDFLADFAQGRSGVYGSRMTGGGFGGCTVSLVEANAVERVSSARRRLSGRLRARGGGVRLLAVRRRRLRPAGRALDIVASSTSAIPRTAASIR